LALELMVALLVVFVVLNAWATRAIIRDQLSSPAQRKAQLVFVWLVPFLGALLTVYLKRGEPERAEGRYREEAELGGEDVPLFIGATRSEGNQEVAADGSAEGGGND
jgi:hypothetical protein